MLIRAYAALVGLANRTGAVVLLPMGAGTDDVDTLGLIRQQTMGYQIPVGRRVVPNLFLQNPPDPDVQATGADGTGEAGTRAMTCVSTTVKSELPFGLPFLQAEYGRGPDSLRAAFLGVSV